VLRSTKRHIGLQARSNAMNEFKVGQRVWHIKTRETASVVERAQGCPPDATTVLYDTDDTTWNAPTSKLLPVVDANNEPIFKEDT
jgi:hypothetical protein